MITRTDIRKKTSAGNYSEGAALYELGYIYDTQKAVFWEKDSLITMIYGKVKKSEAETYSTSIELDDKESRILEAHCDCKGIVQSYNLCSHLVATLLHYVDTNAPSQHGDREQQKKTGRLPRGTTEGLMQFVEYYAMKDMLPDLQMGMEGSIRIEPILSVDYDEFSVRFKIGNENKYILKDLAEFTKAMKEGNLVIYGQKLEFYHELGVFAEESRPIVQFISKETEKLLEERDPYERYYNYHSLKSLSLQDEGMERFIQAAGGQEILVEMLGRTARKYHVEQESAKRMLTLTGKNQGLELHLERRNEFYFPNYTYHFSNGIIYQEKRSNSREIEDFIRWMTEEEDNACYIAKADLPFFCRDLLPLLEKHLDCVREDFQEEGFLPEKPEFEIYLDEPEKDEVTCKLLARYGEEKFDVFREVTAAEKRDSKLELKAGRQVMKHFNTFDKEKEQMVLSGDEDRLYDFLVYSISQLQEIGEVFISDALKIKKIVAAPKVSVGVSLSGDLLELTLNSGEMPLEQLIAILSKYDKKKRFYRLKNGDFIDMNDDNITLLAELKSGLNLSEAQLKKGIVEIPKYRALYLDAELKDKQSLPVLKNKEFKSLVRNMKTVEDNDYEIPASLEPLLREYQKRGYLWIKTLQDNGFGGILADDMGLGKTVQVICFLLAEYLAGRAEDSLNSLIICPASLVYNWKSEMERFAPRLPVTMVVGTAEERRKILEGISNRTILVTSYDLLKRDIEHYRKLQFHCQVIDEAQFIKNHTTQVARSVKLIRAGFKLALTGTPVENRLSELWSIFDYLMPGFLYGYQRFRTEIEVPITQNQQEAALKQLQKMIKPFILRRLKKDVLTDLPDKLEENMYAKMEGEQLKLYDAHVQRMQMMLHKQSEEEFAGAKFQVLAELMKLRQLCCDPSLLYENYKDSSAKMEMCIELMQNAISGGHKILLFSQFTTMLAHLQERMKKEGISFHSLTGATPKENRAKMVEAFNQDEVSVFCISLKAGGTGLNLTAADIVIHYDPWWNIAVQNQATDRAHRIGQTNVVTVYKLISKGTIEENIVKLQDKKQELAEQVLGGDMLKTPDFTREDLLELLG